MMTLFSSTVMMLTGIRLMQMVSKWLAKYNEVRAFD
jgi:hypothetical protein